MGSISVYLVGGQTIAFTEKQAKPFTCPGSRIPACGFREGNSLISVADKGPSQLKLRSIELEEELKHKIAQKS
jgi:hypothetical protein